ncbi:MAG: SusC/RagA family TonB-linked outer membrane protein, partial [Bacteroidales bacterium]
MRHTSKMLFIACGMLLTGISSQANTISLKMNNVPLKEVLESVKKQTGLALWYKQSDLNVNQKISVDQADVKLETLLASVLSDQNVEFEIKDQYINIYRSNEQSTPKRKITGVVFDEMGDPLPGASVVLKGTTEGTITDFDGKFTLDAATGEQLVISYVSYLPQDLVVGTTSNYTIKLKPDVKNIQEVVVTALGVKKSTRALSYSSQQIDSKELTKVKSGNFTNSISGKVSNANIMTASGGAGSPTKIVLRGNNSLNGTGQPLIVIDGMPVTNYNPRTSTDQGAFGGVTLGSDGLSAINSDDIESINILKGPSAAALYGNSAANGAIIITTKSGKAGTAKIEVSTNTTFDKAAYKPNFQTIYGASEGNPHQESWGDKSPNANRNANAYDDFLQTGVNTINSINFTAGNELAKVFASYSNTYTKGIVPKNKMDRHNLNVRGNASFFDKFLDMDVKIIYTQQKVDNPFSPGIYNNPLISFYKMPGDFDLNAYRDYELYGLDPHVEVEEGKEQKPSYYQNWPEKPTGEYDNPFWITNRVNDINNRDRLMASLNLQFNFTSWLNLQLRGTLDNNHDVLESKMYQGTTRTLSGENGNYTRSESSASQLYGDALLNFNKDFKHDLRVNALIGTSIKDYTLNGITLSGSRGALFQPNFFNVTNLDFKNSAYSRSLYDRSQLQSLFYSMEISWKNALFLNHTGRNDWASSLPKDKNSYFFPSVGASAVISEFLPINKEVVNMLKIRGSYTQVGSELPPFIIN